MGLVPCCIKAIDSYSPRILDFDWFGRTVAMVAKLLLIESFMQEGPFQKLI